MRERERERERETEEKKKTLSPRKKKSPQNVLPDRQTQTNKYWQWEKPRQTDTYAGHDPRDLDRGSKMEYVDKMRECVSESEREEWKRTQIYLPDIQATTKH